MIYNMEICLQRFLDLYGGREMCGFFIIMFMSSFASNMKL